AAGTVAAVVAKGDGLGEGDVEQGGTGDTGGDLGHLEGVGEAGALMVVGEDEDLRLAGQSPERRGVKDPVAVALEAGAERVRILRDGPVSCPHCPGRAGGEEGVPLPSRSAQPKPPPALGRTTPAPGVPVAPRMANAAAGA